MLGMDDIWAAIQFDAAVSYFGVWADNKLNQFDPKTGKALYDLEDLLSDTPPNSTVKIVQSIKALVGSKKGGWGKVNASS